MPPYSEVSWVTGHIQEKVLGKFNLERMVPVKRFFAVLLMFGMICAMGITTVGCGKKAEDKKTPAPAADKKEDPKKDDKKP